MHSIITDINYAHDVFSMTKKEREGREGRECKITKKLNFLVFTPTSLSLSFRFLFHTKKSSSLVSYLLIPFHAADYAAKSDFS